MNSSSSSILLFYVQNLTLVLIPEEKAMCHHSAVNFQDLNPVQRDSNHKSENSSSLFSVITQH